jgi:hypothetical protein
VCRTGRTRLPRRTGGPLELESDPERPRWRGPQYRSPRERVRQRIPLIRVLRTDTVARTALVVTAEQFEDAGSGCGHYRLTEAGYGVRIATPHGGRWRGRTATSTVAASPSRRSNRGWLRRRSTAASCPAAARRPVSGVGSRRSWSPSGPSCCGAPGRRGDSRRRRPADRARPDGGTAVHQAAVRTGATHDAARDLRRYYSCSGSQSEVTEPWTNQRCSGAPSASRSSTVASTSDSSRPTRSCSRGTGRWM